MKLIYLALAAITVQSTSLDNPFVKVFDATLNSIENAFSALLHVPKSNEVIPDNYIVMFKKDASFQSLDQHFTSLHAIISQANTLTGDSNGNELKHVYTNDGANGYSGKFQKEVIEMIRTSPDVEFVEHDSIVHAIHTQKGAPWGLARVSHREPLSFKNFNKYIYDDRAGSNVTAYIIDTGVNVDHEDFEGRAFWGSTIPQGDPDEDGNGHGSHCAGTVAGRKYGVAKKAKIVAVKVLRSNGSGSMSDVVKGVEWASKSASQEALDAMKKKRGHKGSVANMSLGGGYSRALNLAVNAAVRSGLHFAVAAGNDDQDACDYSPASAENVVTVGASTINDERAWFSNWGDCVDVFAPGKDVTSIWRGSKHATNTISGTSMASPHVCGILSYLLSLEKGPLAPEKLKNKLKELSTKDVLSDIPRKTPNLLVYTNPPN